MEDQLRKALDELLHNGYVEIVGFDKDGEMLYQITPAGEQYLKAGLQVLNFNERFGFRPEQLN